VFALMDSLPDKDPDVGRSVVREQMRSRLALQNVGRVQASAPWCMCSFGSTTPVVVIYRAFFDFLLHNHFINIQTKSVSGEVKDSVIFLFFFLLHNRAKPILPPCLPSHLSARTQNHYSPL
jgi:hypothetical protein